MKLMIQNNRGSAMLIVLVLILMLTGVAMMASNRATTDIDLSYNELHSQQAFYVAESGLMRAVAKLNDSVEWRTGYVNEQISDGFYTVILYDSSTIAGLDDTIIAQSTGSQSGAAATVEGHIVPEFNTLFSFAIFGDDSVIMDNKICVESYQSDSGTYEETVLLEGANVGSNGQITIKNNVDIYGDVSTSEEDGLSINNSSEVGGDTSTTAPVHEMDYVSEDDYTWASDNNNAPLGFRGDYNYQAGTDKLILRTHDTLVLSSGVYYFSSITLSQGSSLQLEPGAQVEIYMTGNLTVGEKTSINPDGTPSDFIIFSQGDQLLIQQHTELRFAFLGPETDILVENNSDVYGALIGASVTLSNSTCIHYDRSLEDLKGNKMIGMELVAWKQY